MSTKPRTFASKLTAIIVLTAFCFTQTLFAAPYRAQNLRQEQKINAQAAGNDIAAELSSSRAAGVNSVFLKIKSFLTPHADVADVLKSVNDILTAYLINRSRKDTPAIPANFYDIVLDVLEFSRLTPKRGIELDKIPSKTAVKEYLEQLKEKAPRLSDKNCMAEAVNNFLSDSEFQLPEYAQSPQFNQAELIMALATTADIIITGGAFYADVESQPSGEKFQVLRNSLLSTVAALNAIQALIGPSSLDWRQTVEWRAVSMEPQDIRDAINEGSSVFVVLDRAHMVLVRSCDEKTVTFWNSAIKEQGGRLYEEPTLATMPADEFFKRQTAAVTDWQTLKRKIKALDPGKTAKITIGCGIIRYAGMYSDVGGYAASEDLAYRGQDNHGETVLEFTVNDKVKILGSIRNIKAQGPPRGVLREIQINGQGIPEEALWYADDIVQMTNEEKEALNRFKNSETLTYRQRLLLHNIWKNLTDTKEGVIKGKMTRASQELMADERLSQTTREIRDAHGDVINMYDLYKDKYSVGMGCAGKFFSGKKYDIDADRPILSVIRKVQKDYSFNISRLRDMILFELESVLSEGVAVNGMPKETAERIIETYKRLVDRKINEEIGAETGDAVSLLTEEEQREWQQIWNHLDGQKLAIAGHYSTDAVRHTFRLQSRIMGFFGSNPSWQDEVEDIFHKRSGKPAEEWLAYWKRENSLNMPLLAFDAFTRWFQGRFNLSDTNPRTGYVDPLTLQCMYFVDFKLRHDRWATTGSKEPKDAQPHTDTGILEGIDDATLAELIEHYMENREDNFFDLIRKEIEKNPSLKGNPQRAIAHNGDLDAAIQNGILPVLADNGIENLTPSGGRILTDTWKLIAYWECVSNWFRLDRLQRIVSENYTYARHDDIERRAFMPRPVRDKWNEILDLYMLDGRVPHPDIIALRIALLEFSEGVLLKDRVDSVNSEIAASVVTYKTPEPNVEHVISHRRDLYIGVVEDENGNEVVHTVSDKAALLRAFDPKKVEEGVRQNQILWRWLENTVNQLRQAKEEKQRQFIAGKITQEEYQNAEIDFIMGANKAFVAFEEGCKDLSKNFMIKRLYSVSGPEKFIRIRRTTDRQGRFIADIRFTDFTGRNIYEKENPDIKIEENVAAEIDVADKGGFRTFGEKDIHQIPLVTLRSLINYLRSDGTVDMSAKTLLERFGESYGLDADALRRWHTTAKEACSQNGGRPAIILSGVGSSDNDALCAQAFFKYLLPDIDIKVVSPAMALTTVSEYDPSKDSMVGLSWSGTTSLTAEELSWAKKAGVLCISLTGNPTKEVGVLSKDSGGTIKVNTGKEISVYTTKGFTGILYDLQILAYYLSFLFLENDGIVKARREEVFPALYDVPDTLHHIINSEQNNLNRDRDDDRSQINEAAGYFSANKSWVLIGDMWNNPVISEIGIKIGEVRNVVWQNFDYSDDRFKNILKSGLPNDEKNGVFINATSEGRLHEALRCAKYALEHGHSAIVQTYETGERIGYNAVLNELEKLAEEYNGTEGRPRLFLVKTQYLHPKLQSMADVCFGQKFCVALARKAGLSDEAIDSPRNLAKSVTVKGVGKPGRQISIADFLSSNRFRAASPQERSPAYHDFQVYKEGLRSFWEQTRSALSRAIQRLPLRLQEIIKNYVFGAGYAIKDRETFYGIFGGTLNKLKRIIILTDASDAQIAAGLVELPIAYSEVVSTGYDAMFKQRKDPLTEAIEKNKADILINGQPCEILFDWKSKKLILPEGTELNAIPDPEKPDKISDIPDIRDRTFELMGKDYRLVFDKKRGLVITAVFPDILGADVIIRSPYSEGLEEEIGEDTLVIALSRSKYSSENEIDTDRIEDPLADVDNGVSTRQGKDEGKIASSLTRLQKYFADRYSRPLPLAVICDEDSSIRSYGENGLGFITLPDKLDATSSIKAYFLALMRLAIELGDYKNIPDIEDYKFALENKTHYLAQSVIGNSRQTEGIQQKMTELNNTKSGHSYTTFLVIGGAQDRASVDLYTHSLNRLGLTALPLYVDESVHGPYACIDDDAKKYADMERKAGVNAEYDPNNYTKLTGKDVMSIILATDSRTFGASIIDAQRNFTRSGRFILIVKESDLNKEEVQKSGAYMILSIPDSPNELTSVSHGVLSQLLAEKISDSLPYNQEPAQAAAKGIEKGIANGELDGYLRGETDEIAGIKLETDERFMESDRVDRLVVAATIKDMVGLPKEEPQMRLYAIIGARQAQLGLDPKHAFRRAKGYIAGVSEPSSKVDILSFVALKKAEAGLVAESEADFKEAVKIADSAPRRKESLYTVVVHQAKAGFTEEAFATADMIDEGPHKQDALEFIREIPYRQIWESWWAGWGNVWPQKEKKMIDQRREREFLEARAQALLAFVTPIASELYDNLHRGGAGSLDAAYSLVKRHTKNLFDWFKKETDKRHEALEGLSDEKVAERLKKDFASDDPHAREWKNKPFSTWTARDHLLFLRDINKRYIIFCEHLTNMVNNRKEEEQERLFSGPDRHLLLEFLNRYRTRYMAHATDGGGHSLSSFSSDMLNEKFIIDILPDDNPQAWDPMPWEVPGFEWLAKARVKTGNKGYSIHIVRAEDIKETKPLQARIAALRSIASAPATGMKKLKQEFVADYEASSLKDVVSSAKKGLLMYIDEESKPDLAIAIMAAKAGVPVAILTKSEPIRNNLMAAGIPGIPNECIKLFSKNENDGKAIEEAVDYFKTHFENMEAVLYYKRGRDDAQSMYTVEGMVVTELKTPPINIPSDLAAILNSEKLKISNIEIGDAEWEVYKKALALANSI